MKRIISLIVIICFLSVSLSSLTGCGKIINKPGDSPKIGRITGEPAMLGGVCSGWAYYTKTPVWVWRAGFVILACCFGTGILAYLILWIFMPEYKRVPEDYEARSQ